MVARSHGHAHGRTVTWSLLSHGRTVTWSHGHMGHMVTWSHGHMVAWVTWSHGGKVTSSTSYGRMAQKRGVLGEWRSKKETPSEGHVHAYGVGRNACSADAYEGHVATSAANRRHLGRDVDSHTNPLHAVAVVLPGHDHEWSHTRSMEGSEYVRKAA